MFASVMDHNDIIIVMSKYYVLAPVVIIYKPFLFQIIMYRSLPWS